MSKLITGAAAIEIQSAHDVCGRLGEVGAAIQDHLFAPGLEAACRRIVFEAVRRDRPLAWNDVTGNLRASIRFQVEGHVGADPFLAVDGSGEVYNAEPYRSDRAPGAGEHAVVFAPPAYAAHVEAKSSRSVLLEPVATLRSALLHEAADAARREWAAFGMRRTSQGGRVV